jgi:hypothetical protein
MGNSEQQVVSSGRSVNQGEKSRGAYASSDHLHSELAARSRTPTLAYARQRAESSAAVLAVGVDASQTTWGVCRLE